MSTTKPAIKPSVRSLTVSSRVRAAAEAAAHTIDRDLCISPQQAPGFLRQSSIKSSEKCALRGLYESIYCLRPAKRSVAMDRGSYAHRCVRIGLETKGTALAAIEAMSRAVNRDLLRVIEGERELVEGGILDAKAINSLKKTAAIGYACGVRFYNTIRKHEKGKIYRVVATELAVPFERIVNGRLHKGRIQCDMVIEADGALWVWDDKTLDGDPTDEVAVYSRSVQMRLYVEELRAAIRDGRVKLEGTVAGAIVAILRVPQIRQKGLHTATPETLDEFRLRVEEWWDAKGQYRKHQMERAARPICVIHKLHVPETPDAIFEARLKRYTLQQLLPRTWANFPPTETSCKVLKFRCPFNDICNATTTLERRKVVTNRYRVGSDPLDSANIDDEVEQDAE